MIPRDEGGPILNGLPTNLPDTDPDETGEWLESLDSLIEVQGRNRARYLMLRLLDRAREKQIGVPITMVSNGPGREELIHRKK